MRKEILIPLALTAVTAVCATLWGVFFFAGERWVREIAEQAVLTDQAVSEEEFTALKDEVERIGDQTLRIDSTLQASLEVQRDIRDAVLRTIPAGRGEQ